MLPTCTLAKNGRSPKSIDEMPSFSSFISEHRRAYSPGTEEYEKRRSLYEQRIALVQDHNSKPNRLWEMAVNHLSDRTEVELAQLRGLRAMRKSSKRSVGLIGAHRNSHFLSQVRNSVLPEEKDWSHLSTLEADVDQGACGSCWAVSTATMLNANAQINGYNRTFSAQELVSCTPNPHHCGGSGGCQGSTAELAMNWVMDAGLDTDSGTPYLGSDSVCKKQRTASLLGNGEDGSGKLEDMIAIGFHAGSPLSQGLALGIKGWERLPENDYEPLMRALATVGPAVVSVGASGWNSYGSGIFDSCNKDSVIDHAVTLVGYGKDSTRNAKFWTIKNSWGLSWGENGKIRLLRHDGVSHCGTDYQP
jgi:cathepsin L